MGDNSLFVPKHFCVCFVYFLQQKKSEECNIINSIKHLIYGASDMHVLCTGVKVKWGSGFNWYLSSRTSGENCLVIWEVSLCNSRALLFLSPAWLLGLLFLSDFSPNNNTEHLFGAKTPLKGELIRNAVGYSLQQEENLLPSGYWSVLQTKPPLS